MAGKFPPPQNYNFERPAEWPEWKQRFGRYRVATKLNKETEEVQVNTLIYSMGPHAENIYSSFKYNNEGDELKYDIVLKKFDEHFIPKRNIIFERSTFHKRIQHSGESVEAYVRALYEMSEYCDFDKLMTREEHIRDKLVIGLLDTELSLELQMNSALTLENAIEKARLSELVKSQNSISVKSEIGHIDIVKQKFAPNRDSNRGRGSYRGYNRGSISRSFKYFDSKSHKVSNMFEMQQVA